MSLPRWFNHFCSLSFRTHLLLAILVVVAAICWASSGCAATHPPLGSFPPASSAPKDQPAKPVALPANASPEARALFDARAERDQLKERVAAADAKVANAEKAEREAIARERDAQIARWILWLSIICGIGMLAAIAVGVLSLVWGLGFGTRIPFGLAAMFAAMLVVLRATSLAYAHLDVLAYGILGLIALAGIWAAWHFRRTIQVAIAGTRVGSEALHALDQVAAGQADATVAATVLRSDAQGRQFVHGVQAQVDRLAARFNPKKNPDHVVRLR